jgi:hypothetical protein
MPERKRAMKKSSLVLCTLISSLLFFAAADVAAREGKIHFGKVKVFPILTVEGVYDDNIYLGNGDNTTTEIREPDWITHLKPGLSLAYEFPGKRGGVSFGYRGDYAFYAVNSDNDWRFHNGFLDLQYTAPGGLIVGLNNSFVHTGDPSGSQNQYNLGVPNTERLYDDLRSKIGYDFKNRIKVFGYYNFFVQSYDLERDQAQDYASHEFGTGFQMRLFPKTWGFLRYHYGWRDYYSHPGGTGLTDGNDADFQWHRTNAGLTWDSGAKLSGEVNVGVAWYGYENSRDPNGIRYDDRFTWIAATSVAFEATSTTTLSLDIIRALRHIAADTREHYDDTGVRFEVTQVFLTDFTLNAMGQYNRFEYNLPAARERAQDNFLAGISLDYRILRWLNAGVRYRFNRRNSNYRIDEFTDNQVSVYVTGAY